MPAIGPRARVAVLVSTLVVAYATFWVFDLASVDQVRGWIEPFGILAPVVYVPIAIALGVMLVPGALLAGVSGLLFGPVVGFAVTMAASVGSAVTSLLVARGTGGQDLGGPRMERIRAAVGRHGVLAVAGQRLMPGVPDGPMSYTFGLLGLRVRHIALGTVLGAAPRAFSYSALGASVDDPGSPLAISAAVLLVVTGLFGAVLARRAYVRARRAPPAGGAGGVGSVR